MPEDAVHEAVHDPHALAGHSSVGVDLFANLVDVDSETLLPTVCLRYHWDEEDPAPSNIFEVPYEDVFDMELLEDVQEATRFPIKQQGPLVNVDYNLNSPVLDECIQAVLDGLRGQSLEPRLSSISALTALKDVHVDWDPIESALDFHKQMVSNVFQVIQAARTSQRGYSP